MKSYLYLYVKKGRGTTVNYEDRLSYLFNLYYGEQPTISSKRVNNIICMNFSNEGVNFNNNLSPYFLGYSGYINEKESNILSSIIQTNKDDYISKLGGVFSLAFVDQKNNSIEAWNNITRAEPVYWSETEELIIVGNKLLMVHLFGTEKNKPEYSLENMVSFINSGYYADELLPYKNVNILPLGSKIVIKYNSVSVESYIMNENNFFKEIPSEQTYDELTHLFKESFSGLTVNNPKINLGLTGGKDSRLIIAGLNSNNIDFETFTNGFDSCPDVIVAKQISNALNISHSTKTPMKQKEDHINVNLLDRLKKSIKVYEGLLFGYENVIHNNSYALNQVKIGGQGGELLRGGFARNYDIKDKSELKLVIKNLLLSFNQFVNRDYAMKYEKSVWNYVNNNLNYMSYNDLMNKIFLEHRTGRWSGASKPAYSFNSLMYAPFFDNRLINKIASIKTYYGSSELVIYNILKRLEPKLLDIPFAKDRWNFEKSNPASKYELHNWINRKPYYPLSLRSSFNWRRGLFNNFKDEMYELIFQSRSQEVFNIIDKQKILQLFEQKSSNKFDYLLWSLSTISVMVSNDWINNDSNRNITKIIIPTDNEKSTNVLSEIKKINSEYLNAVNKKISISYFDEVTAVISWKDYNKNTDKMYFQIFNNNFNDSPSSDFKTITKVEECSRINFVFEYKKNIEEDINIDIFIMTYDDQRRVGNYRFNKTLDKEKEFLNFNTTLNKSEKYFKIAFKIFDAPKDGRIYINQMRTEYYI